MEKHTIAGWVHHLEAPDAELSLTEFMALNLLHIRENLLKSRLAAEHTEGMLGALDMLASTVADRAGLPYPRSTTERQALAAGRDEEA